MADLFSPAELADLAAVWNSALPGTCTLYTPTSASDGYDSAGSVGYASAGTVACRIQAAMLRPDEAAQAGQTLALNYWDIHMPGTVSLTEVARITAVDAQTGGTVTYEVTGVTVPQTYRVGATARCVRVGG